MKIHEASKKVVEHDIVAGTICGLEENKLKVACEHGYIYLNVVQLEGKKKMEAKDFYNGSKKLLENASFE